MAAGNPACFPNHDRAKKNDARTMRVKASAEAMRVGSSGGRLELMERAAAKIQGTSWGLRT